MEKKKVGSVVLGRRKVRWRGNCKVLYIWLFLPPGGTAARTYHGQRWKIQLI